MTKIFETEIGNQVRISKERELDSKKLELIRKYEAKYPEMTKEFWNIVVDNYITFIQKNSDYGIDNITFGFPLNTDEENRIVQTNLWGKMMDKINRLKNIVVLGKEINVSNETIEDTYKDLSNYSIMSMIVKRKKWGK